MEKILKNYYADGEDAVMHYDYEVEYKGHTYPVRFAVLEDIGQCAFSSIDLGAVLGEDTKDFTLDNEASRLDMEFAGYVCDDAFILGDKAFQEYINENF